MVFALSCTSAAAERVFFLVDAMFGEDQRTCLADQVQVGVMLRYNKRMVGLRLDSKVVSSRSGVNRYMFTHFFHFNVHLARDFQIKNFMQFGALLVASSDRNLRDFERFSGLGQPTATHLR